MTEAYIDGRVSTVERKVPGPCAIAAIAVPGIGRAWHTTPGMVTVTGIEVVAHTDERLPFDDTASLVHLR